MAIDMKEVLAETAVRLLLENKVRKLTVKDIVDECNLSRQAFYYHFKDIPDLFRWYLARDLDKVRQDTRLDEDKEGALRNFLLVALNADAYLSKTMNTKYSDEIDRILCDLLFELIESAVAERNLYAHISKEDLNIVLRYHCQAIIGLLREWTPEDTRNIDQIVHVVFMILSGEISPYPEKV